MMSSVTGPAYGAWARPRATLGIDLHIWVANNALGRVFATLESAHVDLDRAAGA